jgi:hypothetical protein
MITQEIKNITSTKKDLRNFGLLVGGVFLVLGLIALWRHHAIGQLIAPLGAFLVIAGVLVPLILKPAHKIWMGLALILGFFVTNIILTIFFYVGITLMAVLSRIVGKKFLDLSYSKSIPSYWKVREKVTKTAADWEKQY